MQFFYLNEIFSQIILLYEIFSQIILLYMNKILKLNIFNERFSNSVYSLIILEKKLIYTPA